MEEKSIDIKWQVLFFFLRQFTPLKELEPGMALGEVFLHSCLVLSKLSTGKSLPVSDVSLGVDLTSFPVTLSVKLFRCA